MFMVEKLKIMLFRAFDKILVFPFWDHVFEKNVVFLLNIGNKNRISNIEYEDLLVWIFFFVWMFRQVCNRHKPSKILIGNASCFLEQNVFFFRPTKRLHHYYIICTYNIRICEKSKSMRNDKTKKIPSPK